MTTTSTVPDDIRYPIVMGWHSPGLHSLIRAAAELEEAERQLEAVAGPDQYERHHRTAEEMTKVASIHAADHLPDGFLRSPTLSEAIRTVTRRLIAGELD